MIKELKKMYFTFDNFVFFKNSTLYLKSLQKNGINLLLLIVLILIIISYMY